MWTNATVNGRNLGSENNLPVKECCSNYQIMVSLSLISCDLTKLLIKEMSALDTLTKDTVHDEFTAPYRLALQECCFVTIYQEICPTIMKNMQAAESRPVAAACFTLKSVLSV